MYLSQPSIIKNYFENFNIKIGVHKKRILGELVGGLLMCHGKRTYESLSKVFYDNQKNKTSVRSFYESKNFRSRDILKYNVSSIINDKENELKTEGLYVLIFDGTSIQRGADTLVESAIKYKNKRAKGIKKRSTKSHLFTMGILIMPNGMRIPMPRYSYYSKNYCKKNGMKYYTLHEHASAMIEYCRSLVPKNADFAVVADGYYDSKIIFDTCNRANAVYVTVADSARVYAHKKKLYDKGLKKKKDAQTLNIIKGKEEYTKEHLRHASCSSGKKKDTYNVASEILNLSKLGEIRVIYSWKKNNKKSNSDSYKILFCSDTNIKVRKIIELYALRWQVEIFFRELKSEIGLCDYSGKEFRVQERFIDVCLLAFLFLEYYRIKMLKKEKSKKLKGKIKYMRTKGLVVFLKKECIEENKLTIKVFKNDCFNKKAA